MTDVKKPFHEAVAERLIEQLQQGVAPWQRPWKPGETNYTLPENPISGVRYKGINTIILMAQEYDDPRWMTYKQAQGAGYQVKKGEHGTPIQYWKFSEEQIKTDENGKPVLGEGGKPEKITVQLERPRVFYATVFNASQIDGIQPLERKPATWDPNERAEAILKVSGARLLHDQQDTAYYRPGTDTVHLPPQGQFETASAYYATALHELGHWTGHPARLDRDLANPFGSEAYAREELRAEIASMILGAELAIGHNPDQHAAYVKSWIKVLREEPMEIFRAAADAEKIHGYVMAFEKKQAQEQEKQQSQEAATVQALAVDIGEVLNNPDVAFSHYEAFQGANLDEALRSRGLTTVGSITGTEPARFYDEAHDQLSPVFGITPEHSGMGNPYLERKGLAEEFAAKAEQLHQAMQQGKEVNYMAAESADTILKQAVDEAMQVQNGPDADNSLRIASVTQSVERSASVAQEAAQAVERAEAAHRVYLDVPFAEKGEVKALGGRWDRNEKAWYVPEGANPEPFDRWPRRQESRADQPTQERLYLAVAYSERKAAKQAGALWDDDAKSWYVGPKADIAALGRWRADSVNPQQAPAMSPREEFLGLMRNMGAQVPFTDRHGVEHPVLDGKKHRVPVEGDKRGEYSGFYIAHGDGKPNGFFQNNRSGLPGEKWVSKGYSLSEEERARLQAEAATKLQEREREIQRAQAGTAEAVRELLAIAKPALADHPYLIKKGVVAVGLYVVPEATGGLPVESSIMIGKSWSESAALRVRYPEALVFTAGDLLIPAYGRDGEVRTVQAVQASGFKVFARDGRKEGSFHVVNGDLASLKRAPVLVIGEGYATMASVSDGAGFPVVSAFDSGNLGHVAKELHDLFPNKPILITGDDDQHLEPKSVGNVGKIKALEAAEQVGGNAVFPVFAPGEQQSDSSFSDFNDMAQKSQLGKEGVERQVKAALTHCLERHSQVQEDTLTQVNEQTRKGGQRHRVTH